MQENSKKKYWFWIFLESCYSPIFKLRPKYQNTSATSCCSRWSSIQHHSRYMISKLLSCKPATNRCITTAAAATPGAEWIRRAQKRKFRASSNPEEWSLCILTYTRCYWKRDRQKLASQIDWWLLETAETTTIVAAFCFSCAFCFSARKTKTKQSGEDGGKRKKLLCRQFSFPSNSKGGREGGDELSPVQKTWKEPQLLPRRSIATTNLQRRRRKKTDRQTDRLREKRFAMHCTATQQAHQNCSPLHPSSSNGQIVIHRGNGQSRVLVAGNCLAVLSLTVLFSGGQTDTRSGRKLRAET